jgi:hypothetical protein
MQLVLTIQHDVCQFPMRHKLCFISADYSRVLQIDRAYPLSMADDFLSCAFELSSYVRGSSISSGIFAIFAALYLRLPRCSVTPE